MWVKLQAITYTKISHLWHGVVEKLFEELELRNVASREAAQHVKQQLYLIVVLSATRWSRNVEWRPVQCYNTFVSKWRT